MLALALFFTGCTAGVNEQTGTTPQSQTVTAAGKADTTAAMAGSKTVTGTTAKGAAAAGTTDKTGSTKSGTPTGSTAAKAKGSSGKSTTTSRAANSAKWQGGSAGLIPTGGAAGDESRATRLGQEELAGILRQAADTAHGLGMELDFTSPGWLKEETLRSLGLTLVPSCGACLSNMAVAPDGTVIPCQSWLGGTALGNILTDDWPAIWDGEACRAIRAESAKMEHICQLQTGNRGKEGC